MKNDNQLFRRLIQIIILFIVLSIGIDFYRFVKYCETGGAFSFIERPPGVEAFLPISSLISLTELWQKLKKLRCIIHKRISILLLG